jgi:hypothetical protein
MPRQESGRSSGRPSSANNTTNATFGMPNEEQYTTFARIAFASRNGFVCAENHGVIPAVVYRLRDARSKEWALLHVPSRQRRWHGLDRNGKLVLQWPEGKVLHDATGIHRTQLNSQSGNSFLFIAVCGRIMIGSSYNVDALAIWKTADFIKYNYPGAMSEDALQDVVKYGITRHGRFVWKINGILYDIPGLHDAVLQEGQFSGVDVLMNRRA